MNDHLSSGAASEPPSSSHGQAHASSGSRRRLRACHECDWVSALPPLSPGDKANCPRCGHTLAQRHFRPAERSLALALSSLVALAIALSFNFVRFEFSGIGNRINLLETVTAMISFDQSIVAICVVLAIVVLPTLYLCGVVWLQIGLLQRDPLPASRQIARSLVHLHPWMMADVFVIGALVALIKVGGLADISIGISFWAFCLYAVLLLLTMQSIDSDWLWFSLAPEPLAPENTQTGATAAPQSLGGCTTCGLVNRLDARGRGRCRRCSETLHDRLPNSLQRTWALLFAAAVLYIPANVYPIMTTTYLGNSDPSNIISGVVELWHGGSAPVAVVIFVASILVPVSKLIALVWLCLAARRGNGHRAFVRTRLYRVVEFIGRWSMVDIFVVSILTALIRAGALMSITPGPAALAFACVVIVTMLAAFAFDPRLLWQESPAFEEPSHA